MILKKNTLLRNYAPAQSFTFFVLDVRGKSIDVLS